jgi:hypothetical protein
VTRAHQPGSEPIDIPETIPNPVVEPKPTPTPTEPAPKEPVRIPERVPGTSCLQRGTDRTTDRGGRGMERSWPWHRLRLVRPTTVPIGKDFKIIVVPLAGSMRCRRPFEDQGRLGHSKDIVPRRCPILQVARPSPWLT